MALEHRYTKLSLHKQAKDIVSGQERPADPNGKPYDIAYNPEDFPTIPVDSIFDFSDEIRRELSDPDFALPTLAECATHLEFLETIFVLRQNILVSQDLDDVMQTQPDREEKTGVNGDIKTFKDEKLWERRQAKWPLFVEFATIRFLAWREEFNKSTNTEIIQDILPPLDVLMVWHSFLLNPRLFSDTCSEEALFCVEFPWEHIHNCIDSSQWKFALSPTAAAHYKSTSGFKPDLYDDMVSWKTLTYTTRREVSRFGLKQLLSYPDPQESPCKEYAKLFLDFDSILAESLRDAVLRQASFGEKMNSFMWIRSPALEGTIRRGISRYLNFCKLAKKSKSTVVPTLDIDLIWHTHQCTARRYVQDIEALTGKFVNHDDTIEKSQLGDGFEETRALYRVHFGQEYRVCGCWDCQALLTEVDLLLGSDEEPVMDELIAKVKGDVYYYRAVEWARRHNMSLPVRGPCTQQGPAQILQHEHLQTH